MRLSLLGYSVFLQIILLQSLRLKRLAELAYYNGTQDGVNYAICFKFSFVTDCSL